MGRSTFATEKAPLPVGPYSQAVICNGIMYISGQIAIDPVSKKMINDSIEDETGMVMKNLKAIIEEAGATMNDVIKTTCYLADMKDFPAFNEIYGQYFAESPPARATIQAAALPLGARVEIDAIVAIADR
jgi:2-iminobutanoate/2-iminopropanoate deaminase